MTLYQTYEQEILKGMDISDNLIQHQIEGYERELGLPLEPLERIQDFLDEYNRVTEQNFNLGITNSWHCFLRSASCRMRRHPVRRTRKICSRIGWQPAAEKRSSCTSTSSNTSTISVKRRLPPPTLSDNAAGRAHSTASPRVGTLRAQTQ